MSKYRVVNAHMKNPPLFLIQYKDSIDSALVHAVEEYMPRVATMADVSELMKSELINSSTAGKTLRGSLFMHTVNSLQAGLDTNANSVAAAIELIHTGLLIHDDIMDRDELRRGRPASWVGFAKRTPTPSADSDQYGISMAINTADICYFLAGQLINSCRIETDTILAIRTLIDTEISSVLLAQSKDIHLSSQHDASRDEIVDLYRYKTARYSFTLPLLLAAVFSKRKNLQASFESISEPMGIIYQITDDLLSINGMTQNTGKRIGGDLSEHKKTLVLYELMKVMEKRDREVVGQYVQSRDITDNDIGKFRDILHKYSVYDVIHNTIAKYSKEAVEAIEHCDIPDQFRSQLQELLEYIQVRTS